MPNEKTTDEMIAALNDDSPESLLMAKKLRMRNFELKESLKKSIDLNGRILEKLIRVATGMIEVKKTLDRMVISKRSTKEDRHIAKLSLSILEVAKKDIEDAKKVNSESQGLKTQLTHPGNFN